jgi:hypothetical protein
MLKDPTVFHYWFSMRRLSRDTRVETGGRWTEFNGALLQSANWAGRAEVKYEKFASEAAPWNSSLRIAHLPKWRPSSGSLKIRKTLEARTLLDTYYIQTGCALEGKYVETDYAKLRPGSEGDWPGVGDWKNLLGDAVCLTAELTSDIDEAQARTVGQNMLNSWRAGVADQVDAMALDFGFLVVTLGSERPVWALLMKDTIEAGAKRDQLVYRFLPQLFLALLKGWGVLQDLEGDAPGTDLVQTPSNLPASVQGSGTLTARGKNVFAQAHLVENKLVGEMDSWATKLHKLEHLEDASHRIADLQAQYSQALSKCEEDLQTLHVNVSNLEPLLDISLLATSKMHLEGLLSAPLRLGIAQMESELRYLHITRERAERYQQSLSIRATVRAGRWERAMTIVLGLFGAFAVAQVFPTRKDVDLWHFSVVIVAAVLIGGVIYLLSQWHDPRT